MVFISILASPVQAHHPWDLDVGSLTYFQGFLSGLAHPLVGIDHFLFLLSIGLVGVSHIYLIPFLLTLGMIGSLLAQTIPSIPGIELIASASLIGSAIVTLRKFKIFWILPLIIVHGYVLGQSVIGSEPSPLASYLFGILISEAIVIFSGVLFIKKLNKYREAFSGILFGSGLTLIYSNLIAYKSALI